MFSIKSSTTKKNDQSLELSILHVARVDDIPQSGVANVVPNYLIAQSSHANVSLLNIRNFTPVGAGTSYPVYFTDNNSGNVFPDALKLKGIDLVVFHEVYWPQYPAMARILKEQNVPYIIIPHGSLTKTAQSNKKMKKTLGNLLYFNKFIKSAQSIQFLSESERSASAKFRIKASYVRGNGIVLRGRKKFSFDSSSLKLIYVGRLDFYIKGVDRIIEAVNSVQKKMRKHKIQVTIAGTSKKNTLELIARAIDDAGVSDLITVEPGVFGEEKVSKILEHDIFIQLSRTEGQPLGVMEAMDLGMPCVITRGTTFYDIASLNDAGVAVVDDPSKIGESIIGIAKGEYDLIKISENASRYAKNHFDWNHLGLIMLHDYENIISGVKR